MGIIKDRNGMDLTEAEDIKRWQEYRSGLPFSSTVDHILSDISTSSFSCEKKSSQKQRRKGKIFPSECRVPKNSKERFKKKEKSLPQ